MSFPTRLAWWLLALSLLCSSFCWLCYAALLIRCYFYTQQNVQYAQLCSIKVLLQFDVSIQVKALIKAGGTQLCAKIAHYFSLCKFRSSENWHKSGGPTLQSYQYPACNLQLAPRQSLQWHWSNWHQERGSEELEQYLKRAAAKFHVCPTCEKQFTRANTLHTHQEKIHQQCGVKRAPQFNCPSCQGQESFYFLKDEALWRCSQWSAW